ncbi:MAG: heme ABC transporter ATP-binding protein [Cellvibrionaceae bacterium]
MSVLVLDNVSINAWGADLINKVSFSVDRGELLAIIGPNGAGKTTLMNTVVNAGHKNQNISGNITVCGQAYDAWSPEARAQHVALLPQSSFLNFPYTVSEVIQLGRIPHATGQLIDNAIIKHALSSLDISHLKERLYTQLSGGEKQRVQLARVMVQIWRSEDAGKRLLLLDEPSSSLDLGHQQQLMTIIREFANQGVAIVMVAHDINLVSQYTDQLLALCCGEAIAQGRPNDVISSELMKKLYQVDVDVLSHPSNNKPLVVFK